MHGIEWSLAYRMFTFVLAFRVVGDSAGSCCPSVGISAMEKGKKMCVINKQFKFLDVLIASAFVTCPLWGNHPWATVEEGGHWSLSDSSVGRKDNCWKWRNSMEDCI